MRRKMERTGYKGRKLTCTVDFEGKRVSILWPELNSHSMLFVLDWSIYSSTGVGTLVCTESPLRLSATMQLLRIEFIVTRDLSLKQKVSLYGNLQLQCDLLQDLQPYAKLTQWNEEDAVNFWVFTIIRHSS